MLDLVAPKPKQESKKLAALLLAGKIFDRGILAMLHELIGVLDAEIAEGTRLNTVRCRQSLAKLQNLSGAITISLKTDQALSSSYDPNGWASLLQRAGQTVS